MLPNLAADDLDFHALPKTNDKIIVMFLNILYKIVGNKLLHQSPSSYPDWQYKAKLFIYPVG
jgi:hypothetical protein